MGAIVDAVDAMEGEVLEIGIERGTGMARQEAVAVAAKGNATTKTNITVVNTTNETATRTKLDNPQCHIRVSPINETVNVTGFTLTNYTANKTDYSEKNAIAAAREVFRALAREKRDEVERLDEIIERVRDRPGRALHQTDYRKGDSDRLERREQVSDILADRLDELGDTSDRLGTSAGELVKWQEAQPPALANVEN